MDIEDIRGALHDQNQDGGFVAQARSSKTPEWDVRLFEGQRSAQSFSDVAAGVALASPDLHVWRVRCRRYKAPILTVLSTSRPLWRLIALLLTITITERSQPVTLLLRRER